MTTNPAHQKNAINFWLLRAAENQHEKEEDYFKQCINEAETCSTTTIKAKLYVEYNDLINTLKTELKDFVLKSDLLRDEYEMLAAVMGDARSKEPIQVPLEAPLLQGETLKAYLKMACCCLPTQTVAEHKRLIQYFNGAVACSSPDVKTNVLTALIAESKIQRESITDLQGEIEIWEFMQQTLMDLLAEPVKKQLHKRANA